jgi:PAS domain S-box-containing protein
MMSNLEELYLLESIVEASPAIIFRWLIQEGWPVEYVSRNVEQLGYTQEEIISGKISWPGMTHPDDVPRVEEEVRRFVAHGTDRWSQTYRLRARDGVYRWIRDWNLLLRDDQGVPRKIQGILMDITKEKAAEEQRVDAQRELEKTLAKVISGFLPICAQCKAIRDSAGNWTSIEKYIFDKSQARFSHGYCPECAKKNLSDLSQNSQDLRST